MKLTINPVTGMAGDMLVAALLDASTKLEGRGTLSGRVIQAMEYAGDLLGEAAVRAERVSRGREFGTRLVIRLEKNDQSLSADRLHDMLLAIFRKFDFTAAEMDYAERAFSILRRAEDQAHRRLDGHASVHHPALGGGPSHHVHLHEAQDILVDIAGCALAAGLLDVDMERVTCLAPVYVGGGNVTFSHGTFAVPAPAVKAVIDSFSIPVGPGPVSKELLTPTGVSLLAAFAPRYAPRDSKDPPASSIEGVGWGTMEFSDAAGHGNGLRVYLYEE